MLASSLRSQLRMALTFRTPMSEPIRGLERPRSRKWSRNDRVLPDDERHEPDAKEEPDATALSTGPNHHRHANTPSPATGATRAPTLSNHTRTCNKLPDVYMYTPQVAVMGMDRGLLARIDRKLLAGLGGDEAYRTVRVPTGAAKWSTWRRYCESAGISMGRAIVALIDRELVGMFGDEPGDHLPVFAEQAEGNEIVLGGAPFRARLTRAYPIG